MHAIKFEVEQKGKICVLIDQQYYHCHNAKHIRDHIPAEIPRQNTRFFLLQHSSLIIATIQFNNDLNDEDAQCRPIDDLLVPTICSDATS